MTTSVASNLADISLAFPEEEPLSSASTVVLDTGEIITTVSEVLNEILKKTDRIPRTFRSVFDANQAPRVSMASYLSRIVEGFKCSQECIILAMIYIDRLTRSNTKLVIRSSNIHRLMVTAVMLATKFIDDTCYKNDYYARVGGITPKEMNNLESEFLQSIAFDLYVNPVLFFRYREKLMMHGRPLVQA